VLQAAGIESPLLIRDTPIAAPVLAGADISKLRAEFARIQSGRAGKAAAPKHKPASSVRSAPKPASAGEDRQDRWRGAGSRASWDAEAKTFSFFLRKLQPASWAFPRPTAPFSKKSDFKNNGTRKRRFASEPTDGLGCGKSAGARSARSSSWNGRIPAPPAGVTAVAAALACDNHRAIPQRVRSGS
jgi:hypothetical protein